MAYSKEKTANIVISHLKSIDINLDDANEKQLSEQGIVTISGFVCKVANTMTPSRFNLTVNKEWFTSSDNKDKPSFRSNNKGQAIEFEYILLPSKDKLFFLHYLDLRKYCFSLELERDKWFKKSTWGVELDESKNSFVWAGGNTKRFSLQVISEINDFRLVPESYVSPIATDIGEFDLPKRSLIQTYRVLRDTAISRKIKFLYRFRCQICNRRIKISDDTYYAEVHHIWPLGSPYNGPDTEENVICVCPIHHVMLDYGAMYLDIRKIKVKEDHEISDSFIEYYNSKIYNVKNRTKVST